ncbi:MAG: polysaccharide biosynthesis/export family protein [Terracidiphilus sp.]
MKPGNLLIVAILAPALFCSAQDKAPASPDTTTPAAKYTTTPATQDTTKPVAPEAPSPAMPASVVPDSYVIGASDVVMVTVYKEPTLSSSLLVRPDGMISLPLLGDVKAAGKTPLQLADEVTTKLKKYVQDPNVTVILTGMNSKKVYLIGEVGRAGPLEMTPGMTLLQAIATAGGLTPFANAKRIYILRTVDGKQQKIFVQYKKALRGDGSLNLPLNPGDTIVVP